MRLYKLPVSIRMLEFKDNESERKKNGILLPNTVRALIVGASNSGKTSALISLVLSPNGLRFSNIYIYSKSLNQPKYKYLEEIFSKIKEIGFFTFSSSEEVINPDEAEKQSLCIFDDVSLENQNIIREWFSRGRHHDLDCFYLCQSYAHTPKHLIRDNVNFLIIFPQDGLNLSHIHSEHVTDMNLKEFQRICQLCWSQKFGFLVINKDEKINSGRYKLGFDTIIIPDGHNDVQGQCYP